MKLKHIQKTKLQPVGKVEIPESFYHRIVSGIDKMDLLFGGPMMPGILPGSSFCLYAKPGCGKTTLIMQWMEALTKREYKCAIISGEEDIRQLAFTAKRLKVEQVQVANLNDVDEIIALMDDLDIIMIDSFQAIHVNPAKHKRLSKRAAEEYKVEALTSAGKDKNCVVGFTVHVTKAGDKKGAMMVFHTVDAIFYMEAPDDTEVRWVCHEKNRFGPPNKFSAAFQPFGFDFTVNAVEMPEMSDEEKAASAYTDQGGKGWRRALEIRKLKREGYKRKLAHEKDPDNEELVPHLTLKDAAAIIGDMQRARFLMSDLKMQGEFLKTGRGDGAIFIYNGKPVEDEKEAAPKEGTIVQLPTTGEVGGE